MFPYLFLQKACFLYCIFCIGTEKEVQEINIQNLKKKSLQLRTFPSVLSA